MIRAVTPAAALEAGPHVIGELLGDLDSESLGAPQHPLHLFDIFTVALKLLVAVLYRLRGRGPLQLHPALGSGDVVRADVHPRHLVLQPLGRALVTALVLLNGATNAQALRITNAAGGMACYSSQDLLTAHSAIGFYNFDKVRALIAQDKCFVMKEHWRPKITDERVIGGAGVKMVHVRLDNSGQSVRIAWSLLKNFDFIGDTE